MNQKITLRSADHVLAFVVPKSEVADIKLGFRRKWLYQFRAANSDFIVNFDQVLWMKIGSGDDTEVGQEVVQEKSHILFVPSVPLSSPSDREL